MPTSGSAKKRMDEEVRKALEQGDSFRANEITANVMVGTTMLMLFVLMIVCLVLNEIGVFTASKPAMRLALLLAAAVMLPITVLNSIYVGTKKWLRVPLMIDLIIVCATVSAVLGHNVTLCMVFPVIVSTRYFDEKYTGIVALVTIVLFAVGSIFSGLYGVVNLNMVKLTEKMQLDIAQGEGLREALLREGLDRGSYIRSLFINDFLPRCLIFIGISISCRFVASRGRKMIFDEAAQVKKTSRIETELDLATKIQTSMLPCLLPAFPGHENIDLRAVYHPAKEVGGDFYDYFIIDATHVGMVIADVSGKGVGAALFMTISKTVLKNQLQLGISPAEAIKNANRQLCENNDAGLFVTCWAGVYDTQSGELTFVNAGHNPPVILRKGGEPAFIEQHSGFVLAGIEDYPYQAEKLQLAVGDEMFFYTDGVTEATNRQNELYGEARLLRCLKAYGSAGVAEQLAALKEDIDGFVGGIDQFDDITVMAMRIT